MSSLMRPVGSHRSTVYWRRRLVVLLLIVAVVTFVVVMIAQPSAGSAKPSGSAPVPAATASADVRTGADAPAPAPSGSGQPATCAPSDIQVRAVTDATSYSAGQQPQLSFTVTNTSSAPCVLNAGTSKQVYTITSGSETYWTSTDCQTGASDTLALLEPGVEVSSASISWDRSRSNPSTCTGDRPQVPGGGASYHLSVTVDGRASSESKQFLLN